MFLLFLNFILVLAKAKQKLNLNLYMFSYPISFISYSDKLLRFRSNRLISNLKNLSTKIVLQFVTKKYFFFFHLNNVFSLTFTIFSYIILLRHNAVTQFNEKFCMTTIFFVECYTFGCSNFFLNIVSYSL